MNTFTSPYIFHYLSLESASRWLIFAKRKKTVARVTTRCPTIHSLLSTVYVMCQSYFFPDKTASYIETNSFHFPSCSFIKLISGDVTYGKHLASNRYHLTSQPFQLLYRYIPATLHQTFHLFLLFQTKQSFLIKIETIHCFRLFSIFDFKQLAECVLNPQSTLSVSACLESLP